MNNQPDPWNNLSFSDLTCTTETLTDPQWAEASMTLYAHPSGELPSRFATVGWQPLHRPGQVVRNNVLSRTVAGLARRANKIVRGEA